MKYLEWVSALALPFGPNHKRFVPITPPSYKIRNVWFYDRTKQRCFNLKARDAVDIATIYNVYDHEAYLCDRISHGADISRFYDAILARGRTPLIVDCGANIGVSSRYLADIFPRAFVFAVEASRENYEQGRKNLAGYDNVRLEHLAVSSTKGMLRIANPGAAFDAFRVEQPDAGGDIVAVTVDDIVRLAAETRACAPFLIKIDIEGYEAELFSANTAWVERFPVIIIELHDWLIQHQSISRNFMRTIADLDRDFVMRDESVFSISNATPPV